MTISSRTPEGSPNCCPVCGAHVAIEPSWPTNDAPCPACGCLLWFPKVASMDWAYGFRRLTFRDQSIRTKAETMTAILDRLVETGSLAEEHRQGVLAAILKREALGSTGIGRGVAIPHAKHPGLARLVGAVADFPAGVNFDSLDGKPVHLVCLLLSPAERPGDYLRVLEAVARRLRDARGSGPVE